MLRLPSALSSVLPAPISGVAAGPTVSVVRLQGVIAAPGGGPVPRAVINLAAVETALTRAFETDGVQAVALVINSPGGSPTQSALVADRIRGLAETHGIPVLAFCEDVAASGGYWLACAADEIYAHPTSIVGSIGVVSGGFGLTGLIERFGVERRLHTSGDSKARLDPFQPERPEDVEWLTALQGELHTLFIDWVRERRGDALAAGEDLFSGEVWLGRRARELGLVDEVGTRGEALAAGEDLFSGEVWLGRRARELGLVDEVGTLREVLARRFPDAEPETVEPRRPLLARLGLGGLVGPGGVPSLADPGAAVVSALEWCEQRATWSRFGL